LFVLVVQSVERSASFAVTVAPATAALEGSVIFPVIAALDSCAKPTAANESSSTKAKANRLIV
jgi:hypothetical protein